MSTTSKSPLLIASAGLFLAPAALGLTTAGFPSSDHFPETLFASLTLHEAQITTLAVSGRIKKRMPRWREPAV